MRTWRPCDLGRWLNSLVDQSTDRRAGCGKMALVAGAMVAGGHAAAGLIAAIDRGQGALQLLQLALQLAQRLGDLLIHCPSVAASALAQLRDR